MWPPTRLPNLKNNILFLFTILNFGILAVAFIISKILLPNLLQYRLLLPAFQNNTVFVIYSIKISKKHILPPAVKISKTISSALNGSKK